MRNISFQLTTAQVIARTKTVTRRLGWRGLKPGDRLQGCEKCMGRRHGEPLIRLAVIEVVSVRRETLDLLLVDPKGPGKHTRGPAPIHHFTDYALKEMEREGFPEMTPSQFVDFFCRSHADCTPETEVTRIEFRYVD